MAHQHLVGYLKPKFILDWKNNILRVIALAIFREEKIFSMYKSYLLTHRWS